MGIKLIAFSTQLTPDDDGGDCHGHKANNDKRD